MIGKKRNVTGKMCRIKESLMESGEKMGTRDVSKQEPEFSEVSKESQARGWEEEDSGQKKQHK